MSARRSAAMVDLSRGLEVAESERLGEGALILRGFAVSTAAELVAIVREVAAAAPFRNMLTPRGFRMSAAMTNCGQVGWITDRRGYRYSASDPESARPWPPMAPLFLRLAATAAAAAGYGGFAPDCCLINRYEPGAALSLHQDKDERDFTQPIVSVALGLPAVFLWGGLSRRERPRRLALASGDVVVWGGPARLAFHGVERLADGKDALTGRLRFNLTFRKAL